MRTMAKAKAHILLQDGHPSFYLSWGTCTGATETTFGFFPQVPGVEGLLQKLYFVDL
jgi:hypothetical protein